MADIKKLSEILGSKQGVDLEFVDLQQDETTSGEPLVRLILKTNIPVVYGRQITDPITNDRVRLEATDVEMVTINPQSLKAIDELESNGTQVFFWDKEGVSGRIKCNLKMDVSNAQEVFIVTETFAKWGQEQRNNRRNAQRSNLVSKIREAKTKEEFKSGLMTNQKLPAEPVVQE